MVCDDARAPTTWSVKGFHFKYDDVKLDAKVAGWNVTVLSVGKTNLGRPGEESKGASR